MHYDMTNKLLQINNLMCCVAIHVKIRLTASIITLWNIVIIIIIFFRHVVTRYVHYTSIISLGLLKVRNGFLQYFENLS